MAAEAVEITVLAETLFNGAGRRRPFSTLYTCTGPDGRRFDNTSFKTLRDVLRRRYGRVVLEVDDRTVKNPAPGLIVRRPAAGNRESTTGQGAS